jgi:hypothetical protein
MAVLSWVTYKMLHHPLLQQEPLGVAFLVATSDNPPRAGTEKEICSLVMFPTSSVCIIGGVSDISSRISLSHITFCISFNNLYVTKIRYIFCK